MTPRSAAPAIAILRAAFPGKDFPDKTVELYGRMLADLDPGAVTRAVERLINGSDFLPTIHAIRQEVAEEELGLPTPEEAWDIALSGHLRQAPPEVRNACDSVGGRWALLHSDSPSVVRAQFLKSYGERRRNAIAEFTGAKTPLGLPAMPEQIGPTMAALPESTVAFAPPVNARWLRRMMGQELKAPTEAEKANAVEILREGPPENGEPDPLYVEAERIFMEAGE
jgi:hypothetical protein